MTFSTQVTLKELAQRVADYGDTPFTLRLRFGDYDLAVMSNSGSLIEKLRGVFRYSLDDAPSSRFVMVVIDAVAPDLGLAYSRWSPEASDDDADDEFCDLPDGRVIPKRSKGILFASGEGIEVAILPCPKHGNKVVNFINTRYIQWQLHQGGLLAHASSVRSERRGLLLTGAASAGKTTLAFHLLDRGLCLVGKDNVVVRREARGLRMYGTPAPPRVNPGTALNNPRLRPILDAAYAQKLEKLAPDELWGIEKKHEIFIEELYGAGSTCVDGPIDGIVVLNWRHGAGPVRIDRVDLAKRRDLLRILMKSRGLFYRSPAGSFDPEPREEAYLKVLGDCPVHEMTGGIDFQQATKFCAGLL